MSAEANKLVVQRYIDEVINRGNIALVDTFFAPEMREHVKGFLQNGSGVFVDAREEIQEIVAEGDLVMVRWIFGATHQGVFFGIPGTGKRIEIDGYGMYRFKDGQIFDDEMNMDWSYALEQLGATILPPGPKPA